MSAASEATGLPNQLGTALAQGLGNVSRDQQLTFTQYTRLVVSEDMTVFWVASAVTITAKGSLHYGTDRSQEEDQTLGMNSVIFTAESEVTALNSINPGTLWICPWATPDGTTIQIAFSSRGAYYEQAGLFHYAGFAVFPAMQSQIIASASDLPAGPIVSNSLPIFLAAGTALPTMVTSQAMALTLYPSFLVPENIVPPYGVVHIEPGLTASLQAFPRYRWSQRTGTGPYALPDTQMMKDRVRLTFYGLNNQQARQWMDALVQYSLFTDNFGFMSSPAIQDEKRVQSEIKAIAMKKTVEFTASYYQGTADALLRQLILSATVSYQITGA
ncbi:hypothetical protein [Acidithiobacillus sp.]|uniref:hypothetical protein n=1 Tax=Acidithiobacillus sp. TaxID=1872118 RepID=UPI003D0070F7